MTLLCVSSLAHAERVSGTGEYSFGPDTAENVACRLAEEKAKQNAQGRAAQTRALTAFGSDKLPLGQAAE